MMAQPQTDQLSLVVDQSTRFDNIIKPNNDTRVYRGLVLANQLKVVLVSDPTTDKSAGSLSVKVGSLADPWEFQGMAHFLEHALFLTTKKYPEENFFKNFVVQHGGHTNAYTSLTETCYHFDVAPDALEGALDRFAQFFVEPLFPRDLIERELQSIQFEFENTITSDGHRFYRVRKLHGDAKHDFAKFSTGNKQTLPVNDALFNTMIQFYQTWYSANIMTLAIFGKESLDELEKIAVPLFGNIVNRNVKPLWIDQHPYPMNFCRKMAKIVPFKESRKLIMFFPIQDIQYDDVKSNALSYITFLLGHEGPGSLLAELKEQGYCTLLDVDSYYYNGFGFLDIEVNLTQGITKNNEIIQLLFQYIKMLKCTLPEKRLYDEIKMVNEIKFHFRDKFDPQFYVKFLCKNMHFYPIERVVCGRALMGEFNSDEIVNLLNLLSIDMFNLQVISPIFKKHGITFIKDAIYGTEYTIEDLPAELLKFWTDSQLNSKLYIPSPNEFIPRDFSLKPLSNVSEIPQLVKSSNNLKVWHLQDSKYLQPKAFIAFIFKSQLVNKSPLNVNLVGLFVKLFFDYVNQKFYSADLVGIGYNIITSKFGLEIIVQGFNDRLDAFLYSLITEMINFKINPARWDIVRDIYYNALTVFHLYPVTSILHSYLDVLLCPDVWTHDELMSAFKYVNQNKVLALMRDILLDCKVEAFTHGNITKEESVALSEKAFIMLTDNKPLIDVNLYDLFNHCRDVLLMNGTTEFAITNDQHENHGFMLYHQVGLLDLHQQARLELFHQIISEPYFNQIRMNEQLAYMTFVTLKFTSSGSMGLVILIQSAYALKYLESRVEAFLRSLENILKSIKLDEFTKEKNALITKISEEPKSLHALSSRMWREIISCQYIFDRDKRLVAYLRKVKPSDIVSMYQSTFQPNGPKCRRLILTIKAVKCKEMKGKLEAEEKVEKTNKDNLSQPKQQSQQTNNSVQSDTKQSMQTEKSSKRMQISDIRKFKCESTLCRIAKIIIDKV